MEIKNISKSFGGKQVLENVSFIFPASSTTGVTGDSGRGKTTLINILLGLLKADSGEVFMPREWRLGCVFQEDRLIEHLSARKNIALAAHHSTTNSNIYSALSALGLDPANNDPVSKYSGGMRRRVAIARAVLAKPDLLIMDEPFKGLDIQARENAAGFILKNCAGACRILVTHDPEELELMGVNDILELK